MAPFKGNRYLRCFYCNRASKSRYDGLTREFLCLYCDATNYLDKVRLLTCASMRPRRFYADRP